MYNSIIGQVVKVCVIGAPAHLGETFDYLLPESYGKAANEIQGFLVGVKFGNRNLTGIVLDYVEKSDYTGQIKPITRIISKIPLVKPDLIEFYRKVAKYYASNLAELLPYIIPPRHARAEMSHIEYRSTRDQVFLESANLEHLQIPDLSDVLNGYALSGQDFTDHQLLNGKYTLTIVPTWIGWGKVLVEIALAQYASGQSVLLLVPSEKHLQQIVSHLGSRLQVHEYAVMSSSQDQETRFSNYLRVLDGEAKLVVGTRAGALAPFAPDCVIVFSDQNGLYKESHSPYFNVREICLLRNSEVLVFANYVPSFQVARLVKIKYLQPLVPTNQLLLKHRTKVTVIASDYGEKIPSPAFSAIRKVLEQNLPVLVSYPRKGYELLLSCDTCENIVTCTKCSAALSRSNSMAKHILQCVKCNTEYANWHCPSCNGTRLANRRIGAEKLVEQLAKAFPGVVVRPSSLSENSGIIRHIRPQAQIIVATPNAEPAVEGGYGLVIIADAHLWGVILSFDGTVDVLNQWFEVADQLGDSVVSGADGSGVLLVGDANYAYRDALQRMNPLLAVESELKDRHQLNAPPFTRFLALIGTGEALQVALNSFTEPIFEVIEPRQASETVRQRYFPTWERGDQAESDFDLFNATDTSFAVPRNEMRNVEDDLQYSMVSTQMRNSEALSAATWRARTILTNAKLKSKVKLILDPKEFLT